MESSMGLHLVALASRIVGGFDKYFVDGLVNTIAAFIGRLMSPLFRAAQTGFAQNYALVMVLGLMIAVGVFFSSDIVHRRQKLFWHGEIEALAEVNVLVAEISASANSK
jgi:hypothetical protein